MLERIYGLSPRARLSGSGEPFALLCAYPLQRIEVNESAYRILGALDGATALHELVAPVAPALVAFLELLVTRGCLTVRYRAVPTPAGRDTAVRDTAGRDTAARDTSASNMAVRLSTAGLAASPPPTGLAPSVEVVIPVLDNAAGLARCLAALAALDTPRDRWSITVVDDGSAPPVEPRVGVLPAGLPALRWIRLATNQGPASARNAALFTPGGGMPSQLVAFTDSDCVPGAQWLTALTAALDEPSAASRERAEPGPGERGPGALVLAAVGGPVRGLSGRTWLARYEDACASLNLGRAGGPAGAPDDRLSYLPTCNLLVRREALESVGGFTPGLRMGEDVDLLWRLRARGWGAFYLPADLARPDAGTDRESGLDRKSGPAHGAASGAERGPVRNGLDGTVRHEYRDRLGPFLLRKAAYARSETWLRRWHPTHFASRAALAPHGALALGGAGCLAGDGGWQVGLAAAGALLLAEAFWHGWRRREAARGWPASAALAALARRAAAGVLVACRGLARQHAVLGLLLLAAGYWRPAWALWLTGMLLAAVWGESLARRPALPWPVFCAGYVLDAFAYSTGRWLSRVAAWRVAGALRS